MICGVRVSVSKSLPGYHKSLAWDLIRVYDTLMRKYGIDQISWSIDDVDDDQFVIIGMMPGDYRPEMLAAKSEISEAIEEIGGQLNRDGYKLEEYDKEDDHC